MPVVTPQIARGRRMLLGLFIGAVVIAAAGLLAVLVLYLRTL